MNDKYFPLIKELTIAMIQAFKNYQDSNIDFYDIVSNYYDNTNLTFDIHKAYLDIEYDECKTLLGVRFEQEYNYSNLEEYNNQSYRVIINDDTYFICSSNIGLFDQVIDDREERIVIDIAQENEEEFKFQQSTTLDNIAFNAINLEEYMREVLTTQNGELPVFMLIDYLNIKELDNIGNMLEALREYNDYCEKKH